MTAKENSHYLTILINIYYEFVFSPEPDLAWSGPRNTLPIGRFLYVPGTFKSRITIQNIQPSDEGDYICSASNTLGTNKHTMQMRVEGWLMLNPDWENYVH